jgi:hypothetical protein
MNWTNILINAVVFFGIYYFVLNKMLKVDFKKTAIYLGIVLGVSIIAGILLENLGVAAVSVLTTIFNTPTTALIILLTLALIPIFVLMYYFKIDWFKALQIHATASFLKILVFGLLAFFKLSELTAQSILGI